MFGPGWMPFITKAAIINAITAFSGNADAHQRDEAGACGGLVRRRLGRHALDGAGSDLRAGGG